MADETAPASSRSRVAGIETTAVVGAQLELAVGLDPRWHLLPADPEVEAGHPDVSRRLLIGPAGAVIVRARELGGARVYVQGDALWADGERLADLDHCAEDVERARRVLAGTDGVGPSESALPVRAVFVPLDVRELAVAVQPPRAHVLPRSRLVSWLTSRPECLERSTVEAMHGTAIRRRPALLGP